MSSLGEVDSNFPFKKMSAGSGRLSAAVVTANHFLNRVVGRRARHDLLRLPREYSRDEVGGPPN